MLQPVDAPLEIQRNRVFTYPVRLVEADGTALDLTGAEVQAQVRTRAGGDLILALTASLTDPTDGQALLSATQAETAAIDPTHTSGVWELVIALAGGEPVSYARGIVEITPEITQWV